MNRGDLVYHRSNNKRFYVILNVKKLYHKFKNRALILCPSSGNKIWFLKEELEVISENR